jgi:hypothetical protein
MSTFFIIGMNADGNKWDNRNYISERREYYLEH